MVRIPACHAGGRWFESILRHYFNNKLILILNMKKYIFAATFVAFLSACSLNANKNEIDTNQTTDTIEVMDTAIIDSINTVA